MMNFPRGAIKGSFKPCRLAIIYRLHDPSIDRDKCKIGRLEFEKRRSLVVVPAQTLGLRDQRIDATSMRGRQVKINPGAGRSPARKRAVSVKFRDRFIAPIWNPIDHGPLPDIKLMAASPKCSPGSVIARGLEVRRTRTSLAFRKTTPSGKWLIIRAARAAPRSWPGAAETHDRSFQADH
jgi:hypothetical protein